MSEWEGFASNDPYFYIDTDFDRIRNEPDAIEQFYESGRATVVAMFDEVAPLFEGRSLAIEIGCGVGRILLGQAPNFDRVRGVDVAPRMLALLEERATQVGIHNVRGFLPTQPWGEPAGSADYVYSLLVLQHIEEQLEIATYIQGIGSALRSGGIAQLQFDTRPRTLGYRLRHHLPDRVIPRLQRRGIRRIRRSEAWVRGRLRDASLELIGEQHAGTAGHWFVARRR